MASDHDDRSVLGYDRDRFVVPVDDEFICAICLGVLRRPVQLPCEHMFCEACVKKWIDDNRHCPTCRRVVLGMSSCHAPNRALISLLNKLVIRCVFYPQGCTDNLNLTNVDQHERTCEYRPVPCPVPGCNQRLPQNALARHIMECDKRDKVCEVCELRLRNGESHSKDDCIAALKRALNYCIGLLVDRNITASSSSTTTTQLPPSRPNVAQLVRQNRIMAPPVPTALLHNLPGTSNSGSGHAHSPHVIDDDPEIEPSVHVSSDDEESNGEGNSVIFWNGMGLGHGAVAHVQIDLNSVDSEPERDPSLLILSDNGNDERSDDSDLAHSFEDSDDSVQSVAGTRSVSNASYHSMNREPQADNSYEGPSGNDDDNDQQNVSVSPENQDEANFTSFTNEYAASDDEHHRSGSHHQYDSDSDDSERPKRIRRSYELQPQNPSGFNSHYNY